MSRPGPRLPSVLHDAVRGRRPSLLPQSDTFVRGLALGALVGAAIAGSTIWNRLRRGAATGPHDPPSAGNATKRD